MLQTAINFSARSEGIRISADHAESACPEWGEGAYELLARFAEITPDPFLTEDVRVYATSRGLPEPPNTKAWGAVVRRAVRGKLIRKVGYQAGAISGSPKPLWGRA